MIRRSLIFLGCLILFSVTTARAEEPPPSDFDAYVARIRAQGATESARMHLLMVAGVRLGHSTLLYEPAPGRDTYSQAYMSNTCPLPGADPDSVARWQVELQAEQDADLARIQPLADVDGSGFVSTEEGVALRQVFEFGVLVQAVRNHEDGSVDAIARAAGTSRETAENRLATLEKVQRQARSAGVEFLPDPPGREEP